MSENDNCLFPKLFRIYIKGGAVMITNLIINLIIIFVAGLVVDLLGAKYTRYIVTKKIGLAALLSGLITLVNFLFLTLILKDGVNGSIFNILAFAGGGSIGTFLAMRRV
jgi:hypothetical protein